MADRFLVIAAYHLIASRYHSGQWSTGYRKLSQCVRLGYRPSFAYDRDVEIRAEAARLLWKRRREIRRFW